MKKFAHASLTVAGILFLIGAIILIICIFFAGSIHGILTESVSSELHNTVNGNIFHLWSGNSYYNTFGWN